MDSKEIYILADLSGAPPTSTTPKLAHYYSPGHGQSDVMFIHLNSCNSFIVSVSDKERRGMSSDSECKYSKY
eukprot:scaffold7595_cov49-Cyclotella_meneghiniana.AAC.6